MLPPVAVTVIVPSATPQSVGSVNAIFVMLGAFGAFKMTGLLMYGVLHVPSVFLVMILYVPAPKFVKLLPICQFVPPSIEYSKLTPVAVIVIEPLLTPQFVGSTAVTAVIIGCTLSVKVISASVTIQVPSAFLTRISYGLPAAVKPTNKPLFDQFAPPSIENCKAFPALVFAVMVIVPSACPQSVGSVKVALVITAATLSVKLMFEPITSHVPSAFLTRISYGLFAAAKPPN